jgi:hypothetical protein
MAGTTGLEPATSAVTVSGLQVLSTTWKSTDGTASHWKYIEDNVIVYRDVYRGRPIARENDLWQPGPLDGPEGPGALKPTFPKIGGICYQSVEPQREQCPRINRVRFLPCTTASYKS